MAAPALGLACLLLALGALQPAAAFLPTALPRPRAQGPQITTQAGGRHALLPLMKAAKGAGGDGYMAGEAAEMRKNPNLYAEDVASGVA
eukprot:CAMPEP_0206242150 /NCGR_PEP_ID=MMETSP0047_2-20121206/16898_1 /ASSEMBLY_ACC=CAM_ASM_000192 /TAXON_ID=195065 /ORGANISM="Chroomonas mesostigmatica_cf, Strain CCMP1168" /LENGTH=88 /DNA_ID=CAMNT_0053667139 /DNA_START=32 /DNA_END=294 /DNA_ORIENTATION=+